ncbi:MAG: hypothetical protein R2932_54055 [Caldilineaceae bacterium]
MSQTKPCCTPQSREITNATPFTHLQTLDTTPDHPLIAADNHHVVRNTPPYRLIVNEQVRPCFFSSDIEEPSKVVTISLQFCADHRELW